MTIQPVDLNPVIPAQKAVAKASYPHPAERRPTGSRPLITARFWRESSSMRKLYSALTLDSGAPDRRLRGNDGVPSRGAAIRDAKG